jgi:hypothetical protein
MSVLILSCDCGLRMKAKGATPGRVGRCPKCGRTLRVPDAAGTPEVEPVPRGYGLTPASRPLATPPGPDLDPGQPTPRKKARRRPAPRAKPPEVSRPVEAYWRPDLRFPMRGAEGLMMVASLGLTFWVLTVLVPELCLAFMADAEKLGATLMGVLVSLVAALPSLMLTPLAIVYALQYHGRVLVSGAMGEVVPPRPPDRNFDGLSNGLGPWVVWLTCGASIGFGPLACYVFSRGGADPVNPLVALALTSLGLPYALMSLMMAFLDDRGMPRPMGVVGALMRLNLAFLQVSAVVGALGAALWWAFSWVHSLREGYYWTYVLAMLGWWLLAHWVAIVAMRVLGVFYHHHGSILRWHRKKPWWDVTVGT